VATFKSTRCRTGSQCSWRRTGKMWMELTVVWRCGHVYMNKVKLRRARLVLRLANTFLLSTIPVLSRPLKPTALLIFIYKQTRAHAKLACLSLNIICHCYRLPFAVTASVDCSQANAILTVNVVFTLYWWSHCADVVAVLTCYQT